MIRPHLGIKKLMYLDLVLSIKEAIALIDLERKKSALQYIMHVYRSCMINDKWSMCDSAYLNLVFRSVILPGLTKSHLLTIIVSAKATCLNEQQVA